MFKFVLEVEEVTCNLTLLAGYINAGQCKEVYARVTTNWCHPLLVSHVPRMHALFHSNDVQDRR